MSSRRRPGSILHLASAKRFRFGSARLLATSLWLALRAACGVQIGNPADLVGGERGTFCFGKKYPRTIAPVAVISTTSCCLDCPCHLPIARRRELLHPCSRTCAPCSSDRQRGRSTANGAFVASCRPSMASFGARSRHLRRVCATTAAARRYSRRYKTVRIPRG